MSSKQGEPSFEVRKRTGTRGISEAKVTGNPTKLTLCSTKDNLFLGARRDPSLSSWQSASPLWGASGWQRGVTVLHLALDTSGVKVSHKHGNIGPLEEGKEGKEAGMEGSV